MVALPKNDADYADDGHSIARHFIANFCEDLFPEGEHRVPGHQPGEGAAPAEASDRLFFSL